MTILIVDDNEQNLYHLETLLKSKGYGTASAANGAEALSKAKASPPDLVISDILMPVMDGFTFCRNWKKEEILQNIPFIFYTATYTHSQDRQLALNLGADMFLIKPEDSEMLLGAIKEFAVSNRLPKQKPVEVKQLPPDEEDSGYLKQYNAVLVRKLENKMFQLEQKNRELEKAKDEIRKGYIETIQRLTSAAEYRDKETGLHLKRIGMYTMLLSDVMGLNGRMAEILCIASPMHDLGKVGISDKILLKPGPLTPEEFEIAKQHTVIGAEILKDSDSDFLKMASEIALLHHERWDGTGYPKGLKQEEIPVEVRIMSIVDQYDAIRSKRPYKPPFDHQTAYKILTEGDEKSKPGHFDPAILQAFRKWHRELENIYETHK